MRVGALEVECVRGDITRQPDAGAIVNAANAQLAPGGGVAGAIHRAAGPGLYEECRPLAPIRTGEAVITAGHGLPNPWCIHVLGPVYAASPDPAVELASCYVNAVTLADRHGVELLATPAVSTGIFGYPVEDAAAVAFGALRSLEEIRSVRRVRFVLWDEHDLQAHVRMLERISR